MKDLTLPLFSGYLFCFMDINNRLPVLQAPGVLNVVGCGKILTPIPEEQIAAVRRMVSSTLAIEPWPYLQTGDAVRLQHGPLAGIEGIVVEQRSCTRLIVRINLLQRAVAADVDPQWVEVTTPRFSPLHGRNPGSLANGHEDTRIVKHRSSDLCSDAKRALDEAHLTNSVGLR